ncbi:MAG: tRNA (adenosine(37)-N6)-threonylcarbamoyltransferase complex ATPase subunit type 1 TsaE [Flavisolibacter sp.]
MEFEVSLQHLPRFADAFWTYVKDAAVFAFHGEMGAGKTTMISALCEKLGATEHTSSPTFSIINEYGYAKNGETKKIYHIDLYRLRDEAEVIQAGVEDCVYSGEICFVEWPEKAPEMFDEHTVHVHITILSENDRKVTVKLPSIGRV